VVAQSDGKIAHQPQPAEAMGWPLVHVSSFGQIFLLPTGVEAFVLAVNGRTS
jgi:hypothetical protein